VGVAGVAVQVLVDGLVAVDCVAVVLDACGCGCVCAAALAAPVAFAANVPAMPTNAVALAAAAARRDRRAGCFGRDEGRRWGAVRGMGMSSTALILRP
jgi:hypothetical protein